MKRTSLVTGTILLSIASFIMLFSGYIVHIGLGRFLGPTDYGIYGVVIALWSSVNLVLTTGLPQAVSQNIATDEKNSESILKSAFVLQFISLIIISLLYFLLAGNIAQLLNDITLKPLIELTAFIFPFNAIYSLYLGYYNGLHYFKRQAIIDIVYGLSKLLSIVLLVYFFRIYGAIIGFIIAAFFASIVSFHFPKNIKGFFSYKKLITFSIPLIGITVFLTLYQTLDILFVKALVHLDKAVGYYTASQNIAKIPLFILSALAGIVFPSIAKHTSNKDYDKSKKVITHSLRFVLLLLVPIVFLISATSQELLSFLYSSTYAPAANSLAILVFGIGFLTIFTIQSNIISGAGFPWLSLVIAGGGILVMTISCLLLIPSFGLLGAALATTLGSFIATCAASSFIYYKFHTLVSLKNIFKIISTSLLVSLIAFFVKVPLPLLPFFYILLFLFYVGLLVVLKEITKDDIILLRPVLPSWLKNKII